MRAASSEHRILDEVLDGVIRSESDSTRLPLPIRRFVEFTGGTCATDAMRRAVQRLLESCDKGLKPTVPVSVEDLCRSLGVQLAGLPLSARSAPSYGIGSWRPRAGHTGVLRFEKSRLVVVIPDDVDYATARLSVAPELGHLLIHLRGSEPDEATTRLPTEPFEEALAEYAARLMLLPPSMWTGFQPSLNLAEYAVAQSSVARVTVHSAVARLGDPDRDDIDIQGAILWKIRPGSPQSLPIHERLTPFWHLCPQTFIPIKKSKARQGSLIAELAAQSGVVRGSREEDVRIGTFIGVYRADVLAWGSLNEGTRLVLSVFRPPGRNGDATIPTLDSGANQQDQLPLGFD